MKIGFIGTGQITKAVVTGVINSKLKVTKIFVSKRNKKYIPIHGRLDKITLFHDQGLKVNVFE